MPIKIKIVSIDKVIHVEYRLSIYNPHNIHTYMRTFKQLCPLWDKKLRRLETMSDITVMKGRKLNIHSFGYCIVSEPHGFTKDFIDESNQPEELFEKGNKPCIDCTDYGYDFSLLAEQIDTIKYHRWKHGVSLNIQSIKEELEDLKADFVKHWNQRHE